jgi:hypothetical protein
VTTTEGPFGRSHPFTRKIIGVIDRAGRGTCAQSQNGLNGRKDDRNTNTSQSLPGNSLAQAAPWVAIWRMEPALRNIVRTYLRFGNRKALDELKVHRETLIYRLKALDGHFDTAKAVEHLEDEVAMIEAALARFTESTLSGRRRRSGFGPRAQLHVKFER